MRSRTSRCRRVCACISTSLRLQVPSSKFRVQRPALRRLLHQPGDRLKGGTLSLELCYNGAGTEDRSINIVHGFTRGLKHNQLRLIEKLGTRRVSADTIVSPELARQMSEI